MHMLLRLLPLIIASSLSIMLGTAWAAGGGGAIIKADPFKHFNPKGKLPSKFTIEKQQALRKSLPFQDCYQ